VSVSHPNNRALSEEEVSYTTLSTGSIDDHKNTTNGSPVSVSVIELRGIIVNHGLVIFSGVSVTTTRIPVQADTKKLFSEFDAPSPPIRISQLYEVKNVRITYSPKRAVSLGKSSVIFTIDNQEDKVVSVLLSPPEEGKVGISS